eukprot:CAMPEP_0118810228 /NCGR_PEP_ID=MMETSP1162-20130426/839_1 /TAXON_ID=33656 /ORGANISM="Phaeocystis Sp, Strain CCMP2710" /LENGTH=42 /DNA_ID= /DNA_START= /DNA_END= /DNA_ORIENTATION=
MPILRQSYANPNAVAQAASESDLRVAAPSRGPARAPSSAAGW